LRHLILSGHAFENALREMTQVRDNHAREKSRIKALSKLDRASDQRAAKSKIGVLRTSRNSSIARRHIGAVDLPMPPVCLAKTGTTTRFLGPKRLAM
jgi:hypothetical protein